MGFRVMKIAIVFDKSQPYTTGTYCYRALEKLGYEVTHYDRRQYIIRPYDLVLKIDDGTFSRFKVLPYHTTALWAIDTHVSMSRLCSIAKRADYLFCAQKNGVELFKKEGFTAQWLPLAGEVDDKEAKTDFFYDLAFIGGVHTEKRKSQKELLNTFSPNIFFGPSKPELIPSIYKNAFIGFNTVVNNDINMRTFEITINGALLLMERIRVNGMEELFVENKEYIPYDSSEDLKKKVFTILNNKERYTPIRIAGHKRALREHTYVARMKMLIQSIGMK